MTMSILQNKAGGLTPNQTAPTSPSTQDWRLNATTYAILISIHKILVKGKKHYCVPSIDALRELLKKYHKIEIGRRRCFAALQTLAAKGFIGRQRRWRRLPGNIIRSIPGIISLGFDALALLSAKAVEGAKEAKASMIAWFRRNDKRFPRPSDIFPGEEITERSTALARLKEMYQKIGDGPAGGRTPALT